ncbi:hypothetical protein HUO09_17245 [Vibrio sp. Y2-5]|uniref:hypothetical protein n=1 Tax=Vibrio sp. Y2-5 TaxID=2743977 RepID=UPI0016606F99|nr:hypothetical protein [Vibrio sp. Y2-5]MBD0788102.1 hypothetical protein [Vibrio sp. Y2-5]
MSSKGIKLIAKFNALHLTAMQLDHQCSAADTLENLDDVSQEIIDEIDREISKIVKSLLARADKLEVEYSKHGIELPNLVEESQSINY